MTTVEVRGIRGCTEHVWQQRSQCVCQMCLVLSAAINLVVANCTVFLLLL